MSVADEFPPEVWIPAAAQPRRARLSLVSGVTRTTADAACVPRALAGDPVGAPAATRPAVDDGYFIRPVVDRDGAVTLAPPTRTASAPVRLTTRGKVVIAALAAVVAAVLLLVAHASSAGADAGRPAPATVTVHNGDTLWSIASGIAPSVDPRNTVDHLMQLNHLTGVTVRPGQVLRTH